jgi:hypothetical protein
MHMKPRRLIAIAVFALLALAGGVAYATIPDSQGVIYGCYARSGGAARDRLVGHELQELGNLAALEPGRPVLEHKGRQGGPPTGRRIDGHRPTHGRRVRHHQAVARWT